MDWWNGLGKDNRGSRPRCILLVGGTRKEVAERLTKLVNFPGVTVSRDDKWKPYGRPVWKGHGNWYKARSKEVQLDKSCLLDESTCEELDSWWLAVSGQTTLNWDIASTCEIRGEKGLLLIEAKAHERELSKRGKSKKRPMSNDSLENHKRIGEAIIEANKGLKKVTAGSWNLSRDSHYQLSNRFAWAWKLASLGIPVVLVYLGFLDAQDMPKPRFSDKAGWERDLKEHCAGIVDNNCWDKKWNVAGMPLIPLIRVFKQPFAGP